MSVRRRAARTATFVFGLALFAHALPAQAGGRVDFTADVLPILEKHCVECHQAPKPDARGRIRDPKGGLRLDGKDWILHGGDGGRVIAAGDARRSELYTRTVLPDEHGDKMPEGRDPLTAAQTDVLKRWIDQGASFGTWVGAPKTDATSATTPSAAKPRFPSELAEGLTPVAAEIVKKAARGKARIEPIAVGSPLLRVEYAGAEDTVTDADVAALAPLRAHVVQISLARCRITDAALATVASMPRLVRLDLRETPVGNPAIERLEALPELRVLNLFATRVGDGAVDALSRLRKLESLHLWQSDVTASGVEALRQKAPNVIVTVAPELPPPAPVGEGQGRARRR